jgi:DNA-binding NarL/FixJ family response regulator
VLNDWDRMMLRREQAGSYAEYDKCVAELARRSPHRHRVFHEVHVVKTASAGMLSGTQATELRRAVSQLLDWMPHEIVVPREIVEAEKRLSKPVKGRGVSKAQLGDRDAEIAARYEEGVRTPELAVEYGLSESQVQRILNKTAA